MRAFCKECCILFPATEAGAGGGGGGSGGPEDQVILRERLWERAKVESLQPSQSCRKNWKELDSKFGSPRVESVG